MKEQFLFYLVKYFNLKIIGMLLFASVIFSCKNTEGNHAIHPFCASDYCSAEGKEELIDLYQNSKPIEKILYFYVNCIVTAEKSPNFFKIKAKIEKLNKFSFQLKFNFDCFP